MQSHELLREVFHKCSAKQAAAELGLSLSMIYKWAEPDEGTGSGTTNPLDRVEALLRCTNDHRLPPAAHARARGPPPPPRPRRSPAQRGRGAAGAARGRPPPRGGGGGGGAGGGGADDR